MVSTKTLSSAQLFSTLMMMIIIKNVSWATNPHIRISEGSGDTEDWKSNYSINYISRYLKKKKKSSTTNICPNVELKCMSDNNPKQFPCEMALSGSWKKNKLFLIISWFRIPIINHCLTSLLQGQPQICLMKCSSKTEGW